MAVSSSDIKLRVAIESASPDLSGVKQAGQEIAGMGQAAETLAEKLSRINAAGGLKDVAADAVKAQAATDKLHTSINAGFGRSNQVLTDMGRIVSDMPYGIQGIGNNIMPLVESFNRAKESAGGTGDAVKSVLKELTGPMGLMMVGIPVVTSLAIAFGDKLVSAISAGGEKIDALKGKLEGIHQYKDFDLAIKISGLEGVKKLQAEFDMLVEKQKYLQGVISADDLIKKKKAAANYFPAPWDSGEDVNKSHEAVAAAENTLENLERVAAQKIAAGKLSLGDDENLRMLTTYMGKTKDESLKLLAANQANFEVLGKKSEIEKQIAKDRERGNKAAEKAGGAADYTTEWNAYQTSVKNITDYLDKQEMSTLSLGQAEMVAAGTTGALIAAYHEASKGGADYQRVVWDQTAALKAAATADELVKTKKKEYSTALKEEERQTITVSKLLGTYTDNTLPVASALDKLKVAHEAVVVAQGADGSLEFIAAKENEKGAIDAATASLAKQKAVGEEWAQAAMMVGDAYAVMTRSSLKGISGIESGLKTMADHSKETIKGLSNELTGALQIANGLGQSIGGGVGNAISSGSSGALGGASLASVFGGSGIVGAVIGGAIGLIGSLFGGGDDGSATAKDMAGKSASALAKLADSGNSVAQQIMARNGYTEAGVSQARMGSAQGLGVDKYLGTGVRDFGLFYTKENGYNQGLLTYLDALNQIDSAIKSFASPAIATTVDDINWKYQKLAATSGMLADAEKARMAELTVALTGLSVDSLTRTFESVVTSTSAESAGKAMADKVMEGLATSVRQMQISTFMQSVVTPILQPLYASLVENMVAGKSTVDSFGVINSAMVQLTPTMTAFAESLTAQGIAGYKATAASNALSDALGTFTASTSSFKTLLQQQYDNAKSIVDLQKSAYSDTVSKITTFRSSLSATLSAFNSDSVTMQSRQSAQADIAVAALLARSTGQLPLDGRLTDSLGVVSKPAQSMYGSALDYARDLYRTTADISSLNDVAGTQLTTAEQQVTWLEKISSTLDRSYDNSVTAYDQYVAAAKAQIDGLSGIGLSAMVTNQSLADQTAEAQAALQAQVSGFAMLIGGIGAVKTGVGSVENVMSTIELNQATYDAALKQIAGIYDVNASVVMVNRSVASLAAAIAAIDTTAATQATEAATAATQQQVAAQAAADSASRIAALRNEYGNALKSVTFSAAFSGGRGASFSGYRSSATGKLYSTVEDGRAAELYSTLSDIRSRARINIPVMDDNYSLPGFASGGYHAGGARLVGESGPELEVTGPSRIISNRDTRAIFDVGALLEALAEVKREIADFRKDQLIGNSRIIINTRATANAVDLANNFAGVTG